MRLEDILKKDYGVEAKGIGYGGICENGYLYFCLHGGERGDEDARFARSRGAVAIVSDTARDEGIPCIVVPDVRRAFALGSASFYGDPANELTMIGVTGTNGKTTTTHILRSVLEADGRRTGLIGTNGARLGDKIYETSLTTPDPPALHRLLAQMLEDGADTVVMEVSAHALALGKVDGIRFAVGAFTNLTPDHLDFFGNMENYKRAKMSFFTPAHVNVAVVNVDDETGMEICRNCSVPLVTYGCDNPSDVFGIDYAASVRGCSFVANIMDDIIDMRYSAPGRFNMSNVLCAAAVAKVLDASSRAIRRGVENVERVAGRFEILTARDKRVVIDYAHTPDGLYRLLGAVREFTPGRVIVVFGCGGDRDKTKRARMGEIAGELSDLAVITSDNPRSEPPGEIIAQVAGGVRGGNCMLIENRAEAIRYAIDVCRKDDTVVIAGKGHETTQEIDGVKYAFSDIDTVRSILG